MYPQAQKMDLDLEVFARETSPAPLGSKELEDLLFGGESDAEDEEEEAPTGTTVVCCAYCGMSTGLSSFARLLIVHYVIRMQPRRRMHPSRIDASAAQVRMYLCIMDASAVFRCIRGLLMHPGCIRFAVSRHVLTNMGRRIV